MGGTIRGGCSATPAKWMRERAERDRIRDESRSRKVTQTETPFDFMTVDELRTWAQKYEVKNFGKMKKAVLVESVKAAYEGR